MSDTREIHSMTCNHGTQVKWPRLVIEQDDTVRLIFEGGFEPKQLLLSTEDARHLARKLNRVALRVERRLEAASIAKATGALQPKAPNHD